MDGYCSCPNCGDDHMNVGSRVAHCEACNYMQIMEKDTTSIPLKDALLILLFILSPGIVALLYCFLLSFIL